MVVFEFASVVGTVAFALSGFYVGVHKRLDVMGLFIVMMLTANGGGVVRDVFLNITPAALVNISAFYPVIATMVIAIILRLHKRPKIEQHRLFMICDSLGLSAFAMTGALAGIEADISIFGVMTLAFITATGGGIIRDILVNETPSILSSDFYGTIALLQAAILFALNAADMLNNYTVLAVFCAALLLRVIAWHYQWRLPRVVLD